MKEFIFVIRELDGRYFLSKEDSNKEKM